MTDKKRPDITITAKPKDGGKDDRIRIMAFWEGDYGLTGKLGLDVDAIKIKAKDGTVISLSDCYLDAKDWREPAPDQRPPAEPQGGGELDGFDDSDQIPF